MYKKIIFPLVIILMLNLCSCCTRSEQSNEEKNIVKSVWLAYYELSEFTNGNNEKEFSTSIDKALSELSEHGFNRITVQVRPFADAFYNSSYFPTTAYFSGNQGDELTYDPFKIITELAPKHKLDVEAWINPYRVSNDKDFSKLAKNNIALKWKGTDNLIVCDSGIFFNPASDEVTELIVNGTKEIALNYDVASICFDDYFYPTSEKNADVASYSDYKANGGKSELDNWRRENVSKMINKVYKTVKSVDNSITFGISPAADVYNDYNSLYADVELWCTEKGYVDYICPQIYFGFQNENQPFMNTSKKWSQMAECDLYVALPLYKQGKEDEFAGEAGKNEFVENNNIIAREYTYLTKLDNIKGIYIFSYSSLGNNDETLNLYSAIQNSSQ